MGDSYVKSEFRLTRKTDNPLHIIAFLSQWKVYLDELEQSSQNGTEVWRGKRLDAAKLDTMSKEQVGQLYELMHATKDVWKSYVHTGYVFRSMLTRRTDQLEEEAKEAGVEGLDHHDKK
jgi:hypothetical protein